jgi:hypothetical protein
MDPDGGVHGTDTAPETASVALAEKLTGAPAADCASTVRLDGKLSCGGVVSCTITVNVCGELVFPAASLAVHVTAVDPNGNVLPEGWLPQSIVGAVPLSSVAETV